MSYSSKLLQEAVEAFSRLPGIGKKSALRLAMHLIKQNREEAHVLFTQPIHSLIENIKFCQECNNLADETICTICADQSRLKKYLCVVESIRDVMAIEETGQYRGLYHVLGGVISPLDGVTAEDLNMDKLLQRVKDQSVEELILAVSPTIEGETTIYYISKALKDEAVNLSQLARGISFGGELEYADEMTLGRSIVTRTPYKLSEL